MKQWPENDQPASFDDLVEEIYQAIRFAYDIERKNEGVDIPLIGPDAPPTTLNPTGSECLKVNWLGASPEELIRTPMEVIIGIAIRLGAEQERRASKQKRVEKVKLAMNIVDTMTLVMEMIKSDPDNAESQAKDFNTRLKEQLTLLAE